jgi:hypothetical protein
MDLYKIFYAKVEGTFKPPSLGFLEQRHQGPKPFPAKENLRSVPTGLWVNPCFYCGRSTPQRQGVNTQDSRSEEDLPSRGHTSQQDKIHTRLGRGTYNNLQQIEGRGTIQQVIGCGSQQWLRARLTTAYKAAAHYRTAAGMLTR